MILFIRSVTLDGAMEGLKYYLLEPDFSTVWDPAVSGIWKCIYGLIYFLGLASGCHPGEFQPFHRFRRNAEFGQLQPPTAQLLQGRAFNHRRRRRNVAFRRHGRLLRARIHCETAGGGHRSGGAKRWVNNLNNKFEFKLCPESLKNLVFRG